MSLNCDVYLLNYKPLTERLIFMKDQLESRNIKYEVISDEPLKDWARDDFNTRYLKVGCFNGPFTKCITNAETSLAWKHLLFLKKAMSSNRKSLVLEDDAILSDNFVEVINKIIDDNSWDVVFPGSGCNLRQPGDGLIRVPHPASKCTDSYLITSQAASILYSGMENGVDLPIDWELNYQMMHHDFKVCWYEPPIVRQGSQDGTLRSSINGKQENLFK